LAAGFSRARESPLKYATTAPAATTTAKPARIA
jgi:hypothetical protein